ncbi:hypothetical protein Z950_58 [Sulfitobacter mediterraneus KCTC 32188]|nr:hypothetical protein Z950_58 [Sulfitobacter mediterraneus KCTC 32188]
MPWDVSLNMLRAHLAVLRLQRKRPISDLVPARSDQSATPLLPKKNARTKRALSY